MKINNTEADTGGVNTEPQAGSASDNQDDVLSLCPNQQEIDQLELIN